MGWTIYFVKSKRASEILADNEFQVEFNDSGDSAFIYTKDNSGKKSGLVFPTLNADNLKDNYLFYGYTNYGVDVELFLRKLYSKFGIWFADDIILEDLFYLQNDCKSEEEENALMEYCYASGMIHVLGKSVDDYPEIRSMAEKNLPIRNEIYKRYKDRVIRKKAEIAKTPTPADSKSFIESITKDE